MTVQIFEMFKICHASHGEDEELSRPHENGMKATKHQYVIRQYLEAVHSMTGSIHILRYLAAPSFRYVLSRLVYVSSCFVKFCSGSHGKLGCMV